jgi:hypothetical protein
MRVRVRVEGNHVESTLRILDELRHLPHQLVLRDGSLQYSMDLGPTTLDLVLFGQCQTQSMEQPKVRVRAFRNHLYPTYYRSCSTSNELVRNRLRYRLIYLIAIFDDVVVEEEPFVEDEEFGVFYSETRARLQAVADVWGENDLQLALHLLSKVGLVHLDDLPKQ